MKPTLRLAYPEDASQLSAMTRAMVADIASHGGHPVSTNDAIWHNFTDIFKRQIGEPGFQYVVAESPLGDIIGFAIGESRTLDAAYVTKKILHISAVYVLPEFRSRGVGELLLNHLLKWGREIHCLEAELNVVIGNPAMALYEKIGFADFQHTLMLPL